MASERTTIRRAQAGDVAAMRELYDDHAGRVYAVLRRLAGDDDLAQDLAQDVWVTAFRKLGAFEGRSSFGTWVYRVAVNTAMGRLRERARRPVTELDVDDWVQTADGNPDRTVDRIALSRALDRLPAGYRMVLVLHDLEGYTHEEIAAQLSITPGTSKSQLHKARARMRALLNEEPRRVSDETPESRDAVADRR